MFFFLPICVLSQISPTSGQKMNLSLDQDRLLFLRVVDFELTAPSA